ncbi:MAG: EVE domain-containing protein [Melioribacteraceae bacterium]|nr:EVE domain-containing protein [Melioribacteraceae bacterium]MCF8355779.1 EVE domain-containing protein [Melioribacteraceae bacterium]MCF8392831.1 EVE domain-containing protein [Melioribacteraceae bacterium]MCF8418683.1 EVE domain-containing protein [Melioribacteraceae bacterium]
MAKKYWLVKSEPDVFSIDDLAKTKNQTTYWDGVRNYQARNFMRDEMKIGGKVLFYHSNSDPVGVVGICEVVKEGYPDFTAFDPEDKHFDPKSKKNEPTWIMVDIKLVEKLKRTVTLSEIKANPKLQNMKLIQRGSRLSVMPVDKSEFDEIVKMSKK